MHTNRLAQEKSPYLLQHAHNPVDWYAWGPDAFQKARAEDKPIFLSIGYSTCHWCHVMERESFENDQIAELLNRDYISIKVDPRRAARRGPRLHDVCSGTTGSGGWPMSVWLTPDLKPFYGGTYFSTRESIRPSGFGSVLTQIAAAWRADREKIDESARHAVAQLQKSAAVEGRGAGDEAVREAFGERLPRLSPHIRFEAGRLRQTPPNFRVLRCTTSCCATTREPKARKRSTWC